MKIQLLILFAALNCFAQPTFPTNIVITLVQAGKVSLAWDRAATHTNVVYTALVGVKSGVYNLRVEAGTNTTAIVSNLPPALYFFAVIARNQAGLESDPSNEISYAIERVEPPVRIRTAQVDATLEAAPYPDGPWETLVKFPRTILLAASDQRFLRVKLSALAGPDITP